MATAHPRVAPPHSRDVGFVEIVRTLWAALWSILLLASIGAVALGYVALHWIEPRFAATARVALEVRGRQVANIDSVLAGISTDRATLNTEIEVIRSRRLVHQLVSDLELLSDAEFNTALQAGRASPMERLRVAIGSVKDVRPTPDEILRATVNEVQARVSAFAIKDSYVLGIRVTTSDPEKSARMANRLAELYMADQVTAKLGATAAAVDWLSDRVVALEVELRAKEDAIEALKRRTERLSSATLRALEAKAETLRTDLRAAEDALNDKSLEDRGAAAPEIGALAEALDGVTRQLAAQAADRAALTQAMREASATEALYQSMLTRFKETSVQLGLQRADSRLLQAAIPGYQVAPRTLLLVAAGLALGALLGAGRALWREMRRQSIRSVGELEAATGRPVLGQVPRLPRRARRALLPYLACHPTAPLVEAVRDLRTSLLMPSEGAAAKVIAITSSVPGEGKTTLALALAHSLAGLGRHVLLVEADVRRPTLARHLGRGAADDLAAVVHGEARLQEAVVPSGMAGLDVLLGGASTDAPADLFAGAGFAALIKKARAGYDLVVIDTPPVLAVPDARLICGRADAVITAVQWDRTRRGDVDAGLHALSRVGRPVTGLALCQVDPRAVQLYDSGAPRVVYTGYAEA